MTKMLAGHIVSPRHLSMIELLIPEISEGQILVKVEAGAICGSDLPYFVCDLSYATVPRSGRYQSGLDRGDLTSSRGVQSSTFRLFLAQPRKLKLELYTPG